MINLYDYQNNIVGAIRGELLAIINIKIFRLWN